MKNLLTLWIAALITLGAVAQTGPGGVGTSSDNQLWLKADAITGIADGGNIGTWYDQSGNGHDAEQTANGKKPDYTASNPDFNDKPTVSFDTVNDFMTFSFTHPPSDYTWVFVYKTAQTVKADLFDSQAGKLEIIHEGAGQKAYTDTVAARGSEITGTGVKFVMWRLADAGASIYEEGARTQNGLTYAQSPIGGTTRLGSKEENSGGNYIKGDIAESIMYNYALNSAERIIVENYIGAKYGIAIANDNYAYEATHENDVAGIGRVNASNKHTAARSANIFEVSGAAGLNNGDFLLFGHDAGSISAYSTSECPNTEIQRIAREWRLDETGDISTITITLDTATLPAHTAGYSSYVVMTDADGDFSSGAHIYALAAAGGSTYSAEDIDFNDGDFVTFGCARNVYKNTSGNFSSAANWLGGAVPGSGAVAVIPGNATVTLTAPLTIGALVVDHGATLDLNSFALSIDNAGITNNGTIIIGNSAISYSKAGAQTIANLPYQHLITAGSGVKTLGGNITVNGNLTIGSSTTLDADNTQHYSIDVKGNWVNAGTFTPRNGTVTLSGSLSQAVTTNGSSFYDLEIANTAAEVSLNDDLSISHTLALTDGVVTTGANRVIVLSTLATAITGYSADAFINGNLRRSIAANNSTYGFPVGNGTAASNYYLAEIVNNNLTGITYIDARFKPLTNHSDAELNVADIWESGMLTYTSVNNTGVWELEPNASPGSGMYSVKLYIENFAGLTDNNFGALKRPVGSVGGANWSTGGGTLNTNDAEGRTVAGGFMQRNALSSFSEFGAGQGSGSGVGLPIELVSFNAARLDHSVKLTWTTATESNNAYFTVERSKEGDEFEELKTLWGAGNSSISRTYTCIDANPYPGICYYRLKQTDFDGASSYSDIVALSRATLDTKTSDTHITISPNPVTDRRITLLLSDAGNSGTKTGLVITDAGGKQVFSREFDLADIVSGTTLSLPAYISHGIYLLSVHQNGEIYREKLVVR